MKLASKVNLVKNIGALRARQEKPVSKVKPVNFLLHAISIALVLSACGCANFFERVKVSAVKSSKNVNFYWDANEAPALRRVLVMPLRNDSGIKGIEEGAYSSLALELSKLKAFEVVTHNALSSDQLRACETLFPGPQGPARKDDKNFSSQDFLKELAVDAVLFPEVVYYRPYKPLALHYKQVLVSLGSRQVLWSVDEVFDMADKEVNAMSKVWYHKRNQNETNPSLKSDVMEVSMANFVQFALSVFCETWGKSA